MSDLMNIGLKGYIKVISSADNKVLFEEYNEIKPGSLEIITRCLSQLDFNKSLDKIKAFGNFSATEKDISFIEYNPTDNSILFRVIFFEFDFNGTVERLELRCSSLNKVFSIKEGLSILKDSQSRIQIDWKILVTNN